MQSTLSFRLSVGVLLLVGMTAARGARPISTDDRMAAAFRNPPAEARPGVYWYFMDGNLTRQGMTDDLESMKAAGIGSVVFLEVNVGVPRGPVDFLSEPWQDLFVHAVREAERLGIEITLGSGPGWAGSGGPWVKLEQSMQHLVAASVEVEGPKAFAASLPRPVPRKPYFGYGAMTKAMREAREAYYQDVAVLAFPTPAGAQRIVGIDEKALYVRAPYSSRPGVRPCLPAPADYRVLPPEATIPRDKIVDLTETLQDDGRLVWSVPPGAWTIMRFASCNTGATTRPAPQPGLGFECDKLDATAFDAHFQHYVGKLLRKVGPRKAGRGWTMLHIDSWEMGAQNWTGAMRREFRRRRGYDPLPFFPVYTGRVVGSLELSERFLWDLRQTVEELILENHAGRLKQLGRRHRFRLSIEPYDMNPTADLALGAVADVPMCEFWSEGFGFDTAYSCFEAASIAHTGGRSIVAAEAFTASHDEAWKLYPAAIKAQGDWAFCTGINRFVYHTFAHKPRGLRPGMTMGPYGVHWDRGQTWWPMARAYHRYIARCQFLLRQGRHVADICYLTPEGAPHVFRPPASALVGSGPTRDHRGHNFDGCAPGTLLARATVRDGRIVFPGGTAYRLLVLPAFDTMTPRLLGKIKDLVEAGATVVGSPPRASPSLAGYPDCDQEVESLAVQLWGDLKPQVQRVRRTFGRGCLQWGGDLRVSPSPVVPPSAREDDSANRLDRSDSPPTPNFPELYPTYDATVTLLKEMDLPPDFETEAPIRYTHRRTPEMDIYFVANRELRPVDGSCTFRVAGRQPELWDPVRGTVRALPDYVEHEGRTTVPLRFEPHQSFFIVFSARERAATEAADSAANFQEPVAVHSIDGPWEVVFDTKVGGPPKATFATLVDWAERPEPGIKYYAGSATYRRTFDLPTSVRLDEDRPMLLDLGEVHNMARARLNGQDLGVVWCAPWRVDITQAVEKGGNRLEIEVANLWPNRLIGDKRAPPDRQVARTNFNPYRPDAPPLPSGLLGPVTLMRP